MLAGCVPPAVAAGRLVPADPTLFTSLYSHVAPTSQGRTRTGSELFSLVLPASSSAQC